MSQDRKWLVGCWIFTMVGQWYTLYGGCSQKATHQQKHKQIQRSKQLRCIAQSSVQFNLMCIVPLVMSQGTLQQGAPRAPGASENSLL